MTRHPTHAALVVCALVIAGCGRVPPPSDEDRTWSGDAWSLSHPADWTVEWSEHDAWLRIGPGPADDGVTVTLVPGGSFDAETLGEDLAYHLSTELTRITDGVVEPGEPTLRRVEGRIGRREVPGWEVDLPARLFGLLDVSERGRALLADAGDAQLVVYCKSRVADWEDVDAVCARVAASIQLDPLQRVPEPSRRAPLAPPDAPLTAPDAPLASTVSAPSTDADDGGPGVFEAAVFGTLGIFWAITGLSALTGSAFIRRWVETSPKGWLWRRALGVERSLVVMRFVVGPLLTLLGLGAVGGALLVVVAQLLG